MRSRYERPRRRRRKRQPPPLFQNYQPNEPPSNLGEAKGQQNSAGCSPPLVQMYKEIGGKNVTTKADETCCDASNASVDSAKHVHFIELAIQIDVPEGLN